MEPHLAMSDELAVFLPRHRHLPQLLTPAPVNGDRHSQEDSLPGRLDEVGCVRHSDGPGHADLYCPSRGTLRRQGLDEGAIDTTVDNSVGLVVVLRYHQPPCGRVGRDVRQLYSGVVDKGRALIEGLLHQDPRPRAIQFMATKLTGQPFGEHRQIRSDRLKQPGQQM